MHTHTHTKYLIEHHHQKKGRHLQAPINKKKMDWKPLEKNLSTKKFAVVVDPHKNEKKDDEWAKARTHRRGDRRRVAVVVLP